MADLVLHPQKQFQTFHKKEREAWQLMRGDHTLQLACNYALSEMAYLSYSQEQIKGANTFLFILLNLAEEGKTLDQQYPPVTLVPETEKPEK